MSSKIIIIAFLLVSCVEKEIKPLESNKFAHGHFELYKGDQFICFIERNDSIQMEIASKGYEIISVSKIIWKNNNTYYLSNIQFANDNKNDLVINITDAIDNTASLEVRYTKPWYQFFNRTRYRLIKRDSILSQRFYDRLKTIK